MTQSTALITAPLKYSTLPGSADLVYRSLCQVLSDRKEQVETLTLASATLRAGRAYLSAHEWNLMGKVA